MITGPQQPNSYILPAPAVLQYLFIKITIFTQYELAEMVGGLSNAPAANFICFSVERKKSSRMCILLIYLGRKFKLLIPIQSCFTAAWWRDPREALQACTRVGSLELPQMCGMKEQRCQAAGFAGAIFHWA